MRTHASQACVGELRPLPGRCMATHESHATGTEPDDWRHARHRQSAGCVHVWCGVVWCQKGGAPPSPAAACMHAPMQPQPQGPGPARPALTCA